MFRAGQAIMALAAALLLSACSGSEEPQVRISEIVVIPGSVSFDALGDTRTLFTNVRDQDGIAIADAQVSWSSSDPSVVSVDANGVATSVGNGSATLVASYEGVDASISATVQQSVVDARIIAGDGQVGVVDQELPDALVLQVRDPLQSGVRNLEVTFEAGDDAGAAFPQMATTDANGEVETRWQLGQKAGQGLTIRVIADNRTVATFEAQALPGPAAQLTVVEGADQVGLITRQLARPVALRLSDAFGNALADVVQLQVTAGGGALDRTSFTTDVGGRGTFTWTLGPQAGTQQVTATSGSVQATITATALAAAGAPAALRVLSDPAPAAPALSVLPAVRVQVVDDQGVGVEGVAVGFSTSDGNVSPSSGSTNAAGVAEATWTLGSTVGTQRLTLSVDGVTPIEIEAAASDPLPSCDPAPINSEGFDIELCYLTEMSAEVQAAFESAKARWEQIIVGDLSDLEANLEGNECTDGGLPIKGILDDVAIYVTVEEIDGPGSVLGSAGPCFIRNSNALTSVGSMRFDAADLDRMVSLGQLEDVILHEMGHVLGIGTLWNTLGLLQNPSNGSEPFPDTHFTGPLAIAAFDAAGGASRTAGQKVPVENQYGAGTRNGHWRESTMNRELMTGFIDSGPRNPMSAISIASMADLGYEVDNAVADAYTVDAPNGVPGAHTDDRLHLVDDILWLPIRVVDERGRIVRVIEPERR